MELDDKYFDAMHMRWAAITKPNRDRMRELQSIIRAIENEAYNGKYKYARNHMFSQNVEYLREKGFKVILTENNRYEVSWE